MRAAALRSMSRLALGTRCVSTLSSRVPQLRSAALHPASQLASGCRRSLSTEAAPSSSSDSEGPPTSPKVAALVDEIASLTLLEAAELTEALKARLGITSAMMAPAGGGGGGGAAAAPAAAEEAAPAAEKTHFTIKLEKFDTGSKIKLIKEVRAFTGLGLKEAKELVEKAPTEIKSNVAKAEAETMKEKFEAVGGTIVLD